MRVAYTPVKTRRLYSSTTTISPTGTSPNGERSVLSSIARNQSSRAVRFACRAQSGQL